MPRTVTIPFLALLLFSGSAVSKQDPKAASSAASDNVTMSLLCAMHQGGIQPSHRTLCNRGGGEFHSADITLKVAMMAYYCTYENEPSYVTGPK